MCNIYRLEASTLYKMLYPEISIKEGVAKETLIGLTSIRYGCSNLFYRGATLTFFQCGGVMLL